jgi:hypothetical protein
LVSSGLEHGELLNAVSNAKAQSGTANDVMPLASDACVKVNRKLFPVNGVRADGKLHLLVGEHGSKACLPVGGVGQFVESLLVSNQFKLDQASGLIQGLQMGGIHG